MVSIRSIDNLICIDLKIRFSLDICKLNRGPQILYYVEGYVFRKDVRLENESFQSERLGRYNF